MVRFPFSVFRVHTRSPRICTGVRYLPEHTVKVIAALAMIRTANSQPECRYHIGDLESGKMYILSVCMCVVCV